MDEIVASVQLETPPTVTAPARGRTMNLRLARMLGCPDGDTLGGCCSVAHPSVRLTERVENSLNRPIPGTALIRENLHAHL